MLCRTGNKTNFYFHRRRLILSLTIRPFSLSMPITFSLKTLLSTAMGIASTTAAILFWRESGHQVSTTFTNNLLHYNNDSSHASTNDTLPSIDVDNHHLLLKGNWIILISTDWTPSQSRHLQWWKDSQAEYNNTKSIRTASPEATDSRKKNNLKFAYVDGVANPELVALLQVRGYPSIRLVTDDGTHLRTFNRALLLNPVTLTHYLENWRSSLAVWGEFGGANGWGRLYAGQVRVFNGVWGGLQYWQMELIKCIREKRRIVTGMLLGMSIGATALHRFGYLQTVM